MFFVLGLGNPGARYVDTRHNAGFLVADTLARRAMATIARQEHGALVESVRVAGQRVLIAKPQQYMNRSGGPAAALRSFYKVELDHIVVVHDEMDIPFGDVRVKVGGGHGGHNGLRDLHARFGSGDYLRVRVGVGRPPPKWDPANYLLSGWSAEQAAVLPDLIGRATDAVECVVQHGAREAMNRFNVRSRGSGSGKERTPPDA